MMLLKTCLKALENLLKPENKEALTKVLTYHVVSGKYTSKDLMRLIKAGKGQATLKALSGGTLTFKMNGPTNVIVIDEKGRVATIGTYDVMKANGVIHEIDEVLLLVCFCNTRRERASLQNNELDKRRRKFF